MEFPERICQAWQDIYRESDSKTRKEMFKWFCDSVKKCPTRIIYTDIYNDLIRNFWVNNFDEPEFIATKMVDIEDAIRTIELNENMSNSEKEYQLGIWTQAKFEQLTLSNAPLLQIEEFCHSRRKYIGILLSYIDILIEKSDSKKALGELTELEKTGDVMEYWEVDLCKRLSLVYEHFGKIEDCRNYLRKILKKNYVNIDEYYQKLRKTYSTDEWLAKRSTIIRGLLDPVLRAKYYHEEKMIDELYQEMEQDYSFVILRTYDEILAKSYPAQVLMQCEEFLVTQMKLVLGRKYYKEIVKILRHLKKLPGGKPMVRRLVATWRVQYGNRRATIEELDKLKI